ncbi:lanthionine synthetase LanC family protein [Kineosporia sp. NBRC 101731]|uniref:lanthionine synthetase LanC family protein n=1 Tax=Kineosporia sp. NBRC 101731 TaxID=3032199 RepID=UPI0024A2829E|nr:lanthionine synthetase LanC family protein [Kineosporia sp. NBRC 101731]GLY29864.1 hypothetical protein Kisp02_32290 [Kineosporia sp. NBRC 101731]
MSSDDSTSALILPEDVVIMPVEDVPADLRDRFVHQTGDFCVTRPLARSATCVIDARTADLLGYFRTPSTIVDAVIGLSQVGSADALALLDEAFPVLAALTAEGLLVRENFGTVTPGLEPGHRLGDVEIVRCVRLLDDTEVYSARRVTDGLDVVVKRAGRSAGQAVIRSLHHEARVLRRLKGDGAPELFDVIGSDGDEPITLIASWIMGVDLDTASADARSQGPASGEPVELAVKVLEAYARLHGKGVLHGDIHPRNLLIGPACTVTVIDFGIARLPGAGAPVRGGVDVYQAPEVARARQEDPQLPEPTVAAEIYSLGALIYGVLTGGPTHLFSLQPDRMLRQVMDEPPLPFEQYGLHSPHVEACLAVALDKDPDQRFETVGDFTHAFRAAAERDRSPMPLVNLRIADDLDELLTEVLEELAPEGELYARGMPAPTASIAHGAAGLAYGLLRIAAALDRDDVLAAADVWSTEAVALAASDSGLSAFADETRAIGPHLFGPGSFFHHAGGVHAVHALVSQARGDAATATQAIASFMETARPDERFDVAFGRSGLVLGCATLLETFGPDHADHAALRGRGDSFCRGIWAELQTGPAILGASHGRAGMLTALLRWSLVTGGSVPEGFSDQLQELARLSRPSGRGRIWPRKLGETAEDATLGASWCNGAAGYVPLWILADTCFPGEGYADLALVSAWSAYEGAGPAPGGFCCGTTGRALALLDLYRYTGDGRWLTRARTLAKKAEVPGSSSYQGLFHGRIGPALLAAELASPDVAGLPFMAGS